MTDALERPPVSASGRGKKAAFVAALVAGATVAEAAAAVGRSERTGRRWLADDAELRSAVNRATDSIMREMVVSALGRCQRSLATIEAIAGDPDAADYVRLSAAKALASYGLRLLELAGMADRLETIERTLEIQVVRVPYGKAADHGRYETADRADRKALGE